MTIKRHSKLSGNPDSPHWKAACQLSGYPAAKLGALFEAMRRDRIAPDGQALRKMELVLNNKWWVKDKNHHMQLAVLCWLLNYFNHEGKGIKLGKKPAIKLVRRRIRMIRDLLPRSVVAGAPVFEQQLALAS